MPLDVEHMYMFCQLLLLSMSNFIKLVQQGYAACPDSFLAVLIFNLFLDRLLVFPCIAWPIKTQVSFSFFFPSDHINAAILMNEARVRLCLSHVPSAGILILLDVIKSCKRSNASNYLQQTGMK